MKLFCLTLAVVLLGCGGAHSTSTPPGQSLGCTVTLSGALTGTYDCQPASTVWSSSSNLGGFSFTIPQSGSAPAIQTSIGWAGEPHVGHYRNSDAGAKGGVTVTAGSGAAISVWAATVGTESPAIGSYDLLFTSISNAVTTSSGKAYTGEGTLDATLQPLTGQGGTVTLHAVF